ncbi:hypothetical protein [Epilithonimonas sp.]|uniref:hypothetical protein n=1 Tax=Epilithonimonas sp. TaxID=2894511 RepID=UPI0028987D08|nr:hypothetical protein [Epilithonimonas sp.]
MKKKINIIYQLLACTLVFSTGTISAQTGILTQNPIVLLHIDSKKDGSDTPGHITNDVVVTAEGRLGVGLLSPATKVDLRPADSSDSKGVIGVGSNSQLAGDAGAGAIRYTPGDNPNTTAVETTGYLAYSDGEKWVPLPLIAPAKVSMSGSKNSALSVPNNTSTKITNWTMTGNTDGYFNTSTNEFTAPRAGFYLVTFNITLGPNTGAAANILNNTFIETSIETMNAPATTIPRFITVNSYPAFQASGASATASTVRNYISGNCNGIFYLNSGSKIYFQVKHTTGGTRSVVADGTLNNFSIREL